METANEAKELPAANATKVFENELDRLATIIARMLANQPFLEDTKFFLVKNSDRRKLVLNLRKTGSSKKASAWQPEIASKNKSKKVSLPNDDTTTPF